MNILNSSRWAIATVLLAFAFPNFVAGHFIWVAKTGADHKVKVFFGEGPFPDQAKFLDGLEDLKVWSVNESGKATVVKFEKKTDGSEGWFECLSENNLSRVDARCEYGVFGRGDKTMFLDYSAKYLEVLPGMKTLPNNALPLDVAVKTNIQSVEFKISYKGAPASGCELQIVDGKDDTHELKADANGSVTFPALPKRKWLVRAKFTEAKSGSHNGQEFSEKRFYCTMVLAVPGTLTSAKEAKSSATGFESSKVTCTSPYAELPVGITSFGGAVSGDHVYVFGGHCGDPHDYYKSGQNSKLYKLDVNSPSQWKAIHESSGLQGLAMVEHAGSLYRVGGFEARNAQGDDQDLHSVRDFARFNFEKMLWEQLVPMPTPRSSLDAVVVADTLFVMGGWAMKGSAGKTWHDTAISIDLSKPDAEWQEIDVPFQRRAMSVGYFGDQLYVVGGMRSKGGPTNEVNVYSMKTGAWSKGPKLPGSNSMEGFGSSCFNIDGRLVVSTYSGDVLRLSADASEWEKLHELETGRFFHRLLPLPGGKFMLVGGANMGTGKLLDIPVFKFN